MTENRLRSLTGIKPTGTPHLGNYLGAIVPALDLAQKYDALYFIADMHALTTVHDSGRMRELTLELAATWLACGLDPEKITFFRQSDNPDHSELSWILSCFTAKGLLNRAHAYKAVTQANEEAGREIDDGVSAGLYTYPVLMAADIVLYDTNVVPVGMDQKQHVEIARDIVNAFNSTFKGEILTAPQPFIVEDVQTVVGLDGRKMSKSYDNEIPLFAPPKQLRKLVMSIVTDSKTVEEPKDPETDNVFAMYKHFATPEQIEELAKNYQNGGVGYGDAKQLLFDAIDSTISAKRDLYNELLAKPAELESILLNGAERARAMSSVTLNRVRDTVGFRLP